MRASFWKPIIGCQLLLPLVVIDQADAAEIDLQPALVFHASFDGGYAANLAGGSGSIYTAETLARKQVRKGNHRSDVTIARGIGRYGDALRFGGVAKQVLFYRADELPYRDQNWSGTVSFWLRLDPDKDLEPGFSDPIQLTEKKWNDAAMFVDFDKELPRSFRLGVFSNYEKWNPNNTPWDQIPETQRPLVTVEQPPFSRQAWTHVLFTFDNVNPSDNAVGSSSLYLNGQQIGTLTRRLYLQWDVSQAAIMLGIQYIGDFDDLAIFNRALSAAEVAHLYQLPNGASDIGARE